MGPLAAWRIAEVIGRAFGKPSSSIYFQVAPHGGIVEVVAAFATSTDVCGAGGDLPRDCGSSITTRDGEVAGPCTVDGEPRD